MMSKVWSDSLYSIHPVKLMKHVLQKTRISV